MKSELTIYRSSAGSGKTFTLTKEYLTLAFQSKSYFKNILAVTFTNKASNEMKARIISSLYEIITNDTSDIASSITNKLNINTQQLKDKARQLLFSILYQYSYLSILTIDTFFQRIIRSFTKELGLYGGFHISLEEQEALSNVIDEIINNLKQEDDFTYWLTQLAELKIKEGRTWNIKNELLTLSNELLKEEIKDIEAHLFVDHSSQKWKQLIQQIFKLKTSFEQKLQDLAKYALELIKNNGLIYEDFLYKKSGVIGFFIKLSSKKIEKPGTRVLKCVNNNEGWYSKSSTQKELIEKVLLNGLQDTLNNIISLYEQQFIYYNTAKETLRYVHIYPIMHSINKKLNQYKQDNQLMLISDTSNFLRHIIDDNPTPFVYEKVGNRYYHFLIDEFQDTSAFQWENFKPLIKNSLSEGYVNFIVGDLKQSIYRWRGGDWELFLEKVARDIGKEYIQNKPLETNWRSTKNIISFNNTLFKHITLDVVNSLTNKSENLDEEIKSIFLREIDKISSVFENVDQKYPQNKKDKSDGYIKIQFIDSSSDNWKDNILHESAKTIEKLQEQGHSLKDIVFLVRDKNEAKLIANYFLNYQTQGNKKYRYDIISSESLFLYQAASIRLIIAILTYLNNESNDVVKITILQEYYTYIKKTENNIIEQFELIYSKLNAWEDLLPKRFKQEKEKLKKLPLNELIENLIQIFALNEINGENIYLETFQDIVLHYIKREDGYLDGFLLWYEDYGEQQSVILSEDIDAIRIMTIHKSKGLQFKTVIVPFCTWSIDHKATSSPLIWCNTDKEPFNQFHKLPLQYSKRLEDTLFQKNYYIEQTKAYLDNLNLLYVALTRPENNLFVFSGIKSPSKDLNHIGDLIFHFFNNNNNSQKDEVLDLKKHWDNEKGIFETGKLAQHKRKEFFNKDSTQSLIYNSNQWRTKISVTKYSDLLSSNEETLELKIHYGKILHQILAKIESKNTYKDTITSFLKEGLITEEEQKNLEDTVDKLFSIPDIAAWFDTPSLIKKEASILTPSGKEYRPDRVILEKDQTIIIDFKTGETRVSDENQIKRYAQLLYNMGYKNVKAFLIYTQTLYIKEVLV